MEYRYSGHGVYETEYHICWITKYRRKVLNPGVEAYLKKVIHKIVREMAEVEIKEIGADKDHIHMVLIIPPKYSVASVVGRIKSQSASQIRDKFSFIKKVYWNEEVLWSPGYYVSTVGKDEEKIRKYVRWQGQRDLGQIKITF